MMTFQQYVGVLAKELDVTIETEEDACAFSLESSDGETIEVLLQGFDERGVLLTYADLGEPPPEGKELLYQTLLEANDFYNSTAGATLSLNSKSGHVRLQRCDDMDTLSSQGPAHALTTFADTAAAWKKIIADFRAAPSHDSNEQSAPFNGMLV
ncbi:MAG: type III secretion system chaperone [Victivallales bacterium]|nr:type III secretion system chaperone [Victivallales bacterium]